MIIVNGKYASATIFTNHVEDYALAQVQMICDQKASDGSRVCVMPDVHPGKVGPIGLTMTLTDAVLPALVGIDIGCGISAVKLKAKRLEFQKLDTVIREQIPSGFQNRKKLHRFAADFPLEDLKCYRHLNPERALLSMGTLGGGNHFIEIDRDEDGSLYAVVHSGSRSLGKAVAEYYLKEGARLLKEQGEEVPYELTYLTGTLMKDYLSDLQVVQKFAEQNRAAMLDELTRGMKLKTEDEFSCIHNYIEVGCKSEPGSDAEFTQKSEFRQGTELTRESEFRQREELPHAMEGSQKTEIGQEVKTDWEKRQLKVLRKGAISARAGETVLIPINMRDGVIFGVGKGNADWNYSAPHGSGRLLKRTDVAANYTVSSYKSAMKGIYSTCINKDTLDEAPFAYRGIDEIADLISDTVEISQIWKPVFNFKAGSAD